MLLLFNFLFESDREQRSRGERKERRGEVGEKKIKRGRLGGGAHEGEALSVLMLFLEGPSCHHDVDVHLFRSGEDHNQSIHPSLPPPSWSLSPKTHTTIPSVRRIQRNTASKQRERRTRLTLFAATSRDVKWGFGMAINPIEILLITVQLYSTYIIP